MEKYTARGRATARMHKLELARMKNELEKEAERRIRTDREESDKLHAAELARVRAELLLVLL